MSRLGLVKKLAVAPTPRWPTLLALPDVLECTRKTVVPLVNCVQPPRRERKTLARLFFWRFQVNGQYQPVLQARPGEALRVRLVHGGNNDHMYISLVQSSRDSSSSRTQNKMARKGARHDKNFDTEETTAGTSIDDSDKHNRGNCTLLTLARDGVYLKAPRVQGGRTEHVVLPPGSRADLAVLCDRPGVYRLASTNGKEGEEEAPMAYLGQKTDVFEGEKRGRAAGRRGGGGVTRALIMLFCFQGLFCCVL